MKIWTVHLRDGHAPELVREGFSPGALLFGPLWLLAHRAWIPAALLFAAWVLVAAFAPPAGAAALVLAAGLLGHDARRWSLALGGWKLATVVAARDEEAAFGRLMAARPDLIPDAAGLPA